MQSWAFAANVGTIDATNIVANLFYTYHVVFVTRIKRKWRAQLSYYLHTVYTVYTVDNTSGFLCFVKFSVDAPLIQRNALMQLHSNHPLHQPNLTPSSAHTDFHFCTKCVCIRGGGDAINCK